MPALASPFDALAPLRFPPDLRLTPQQFELLCAENREAVLQLAADGRVIAMTPTANRKERAVEVRPVPDSRVCSCGWPKSERGERARLTLAVPTPCRQWKSLLPPAGRFFLSASRWTGKSKIPWLAQGFPGPLRFDLRFSTRSAAIPPSPVMGPGCAQFLKVRSLDPHHLQPCLSHLLETPPRLIAFSAAAPKQARF